MRYGWAWPVLLAATVILAGAGPVAPEVPDRMSRIPHFDKGVHFFVFGLLATLILRVFFREGIRSAVPVLLAVLLTSAFGLADELHQSTNPVRDFAWTDWIADTAGAAVAVAAYLGWGRYRGVLERELKRKRPPDSARRPQSSEPPPVARKVEQASGRH